MATAAARRTDLESGNLPKLCVKTGVPTETTTGIRLTSAPGWTWILILFGIVPFLIVRWIASKSVRGRIPVTEAARAQARRTVWILGAVLAVGVVLIVIALAGGPTAIMWIGLGLVAAALVALTGGQSTWWVDGQLRDDWVWLRGLHPTFARALGEQYHDLSADQRPR